MTFGNVLDFLGRDIAQVAVARLIVPAVIFVQSAWIGCRLCLRKDFAGAVDATLGI